VALNIKNTEVERLVDELARLTGETKTEAVRQALVERRERLSYRVAPMDRETRVRRYLSRDVWPTIPPDQRGRRLTEAEEDEILGYGASGV
jgi:antitoxin VapB